MEKNGIVVVDLHRGKAKKFFWDDLILFIPMPYIEDCT